MHFKVPGVFIVVVLCMHLYFPITPEHPTDANKLTSTRCEITWWLERVAISWTVWQTAVAERSRKAATTVAGRLLERADSGV